MENQDVQWNLDQAIAWVMTRDYKISSMLEHGGIPLLVSYPMDSPFYFHAEIKRPVEKFWKKFGRATYKDLLSAFRNGKVTAKGTKNGMGDALDMPSDCWEDLEIKMPSLLDRNEMSFAINKNGNGTYWNGIRVSKSQLIRVFKDYPENINASAPNNLRKHKEAYDGYLLSQIDLFLAGAISKPWGNQVLEEAEIKKVMGSGFNRKNFRSARKDILARIPHSNKTRLSQEDLRELRFFLEKKAAK